MSPQEAKDSVRAWWQDLPAIEKWLRGAGGLAVIAIGGLTGFHRVYQIPTRLDRVEAQVDTLVSRSDVRDRRDALNLIYMERVTCTLDAQAGVISRTIQDCRDDFERDRLRIP